MTNMCQPAGWSVLPPSGPAQRVPPAFWAWARLVTATARVAAAMAEGAPRAVAALPLLRKTIEALQTIGRALALGQFRGSVPPVGGTSVLTRLLWVYSLIQYKTKAIMELIELRERLLDPPDEARLRLALMEFAQLGVAVLERADAGDAVAKQVLGLAVWALGLLEDNAYVDGLRGAHAHELLLWAKRISRKDPEDLVQETLLRFCCTIRRGRDGAGQEDFLRWAADRANVPRGARPAPGDDFLQWLAGYANLPGGARPALGHEAGFLYKTLVNLGTLRKNPPLFRDNDICDPDDFFVSLATRSGVPPIVANALDGQLKNLLTRLSKVVPGMEIKRRLLRIALNRLIAKTEFYRVFVDHPLLQEALSESARNELADFRPRPEDWVGLWPSPWKRVCVHRLILHDLFPNALAAPAFDVIFSLDQPGLDGRPVVLPSPVPSPSVQAQVKEELQARLAKAEVYLEDLKTCVSDLDPIGREAFTLRHFAGLDQKDGARVAGARNTKGEFDAEVFNCRTQRAEDEVRLSMRKKNHDVWCLLDPKSWRWRAVWSLVSEDGFVPQSQSPGGKSAIGILDLLDVFMQKLPADEAEAFTLALLNGVDAQKAEPMFRVNLARAKRATKKYLDSEGRDARALLLPRAKSGGRFWQWLRNSSWWPGGVNRPQIL